MAEPIVLDVEGVGKFQIREELSIIEDQKLDMQISEFLETETHLYRAKIAQLRGDTEKKIEEEQELTADEKLRNVAADGMQLQLNFVGMAFELEAVVTKRPKGFGSFKALTDYATLMKVWVAYRQKKNKPAGDSES